MFVKENRFEIKIIASNAGDRNYFVEVTGKRLDTEQYAVGPNNSIGSLIARICNRLEIDLAVDD